ncbi:uncharacterized protein OCT59_003586 [Rhizophagus irregularis]|uniref:HTH myb-type domain-containing protein n=2 Tax=Rhizophagus irregularis TaxID=588596 RepID=A0A015LCT9_RHIIW|nr:hypothetical protein RirG_022820 [Rhizophagus irregularis DAOM 197198w]UZO12036.1 hypothetical protein OCT59_003586 [Rhizophagus irregularis]GET63881.1 hypothetical protein GLOIN_2v1880295 [Rhizophagus irregularis DAOM 181602=DAOM 197198]CAG8527560.1 10077_t:CDS:2 [Rhizophagus irregularis]
MYPNLSEKESARKIIKEESTKDALLFDKEKPVKEIKKRINEGIKKKLKNKKPRKFMKGVKKRRSIFDEESDQTILDKMAEFETKKERSPFVEIAKIIPYDQRQICNRWRNYLNPKLCHAPLGEGEKQFINKWISKREPSTKTKPNSGKILKRKKYEKPIEWKILRQDLENEFGLFRSENIIKNYWYPNLKIKEKEENNDLKVIQEDIEENENMIVSSPCEDAMVSNNVYNNTARITIMSPPHSVSRSLSLPPISSILNNLPPPQRSHTLPSISGIPPRFLDDDSTQSRTLPPISSIWNNPSQCFILPSTSFISNEPSCLYYYSTQNRPRLPPPSSISDMTRPLDSFYQRQLGPLRR